jgi:2-(1,2-epoxy-1,2-dihydrophenyl)acetyl-CoA isomerase
MNEGTIGVALEGRNAVLTFEAPARLNALSLQMREQLRDALQEAQDNAGVRAIVLTGAGTAFSAGGDIRHMATRPAPMVARQRLKVLHDVVRLIIGGPKPVVAAVQGIAYGAGLSLAAACDFVVAGQGSRFSAAFGRLGLVADCGLLWTLPQRAGLGRTRDILMTGRPFDVDDAHRWGIVDQVAPKGNALATALAKAEEYASIAPLAIAATKSALLRRPNSLDAALSIESDLQDFLRETRDHAEACDAFLQKRPMNFEGR